MKNKIVGIGVGMFLFILVVIYIGTHHDPNNFNGVTELYITIIDHSFINKTTTRSLIINNKETLNELTKSFKKFELVPQKITQNQNFITDYEVKMNNGYTLTFSADWNNFDQNCHATLNGTDLEQCAPKDFFLQIINIIKANT